MNSQLLSLKDIIGLIADLMSIFGITGFFTWSFFKKSTESKDPAKIGISIFAFGVKFFISAAFVGLLLIPALYAHMFLVTMFSGTFTVGDGFWNPNKSTEYILSYLFNALWLIPAAILPISSLYAWSLEPFSEFSKAFTRK